MRFLIPGNLHNYSRLIFLLLLLLVFSAAFGLTVWLWRPAEHAPAAEARAAEAHCRHQSTSTETCYSQTLEGASREKGPKHAFGVLFALQTLDPSANGCHFIAHGIGYGAFDRDPARWQEHVRTINRACTYGAIHGVVEKHLATLPEGKATKTVLPTICGDEPVADCNHIVGHLVLVEAGGKIPAALNLCTAFSDPGQRYFCDTGVFMEEITALNLVKHGLSPESELDWAGRVPELETLCRSYNGDAAVACWEEITHAALIKFHYDPAVMFDFCASAQVEEGAKRCRRHAIGIIATQRGFDLTALSPMCSLPQPHDADFERDCHVTLAASFLSTIPRNARHVVDFCATSDSRFRSPCFAQIGYILRGNSTLAPSELDEICRAAPPEFESRCRGEGEGASPAEFRSD